MALAVTGNPMDEARFETLRSPSDLGRWAGSLLGATVAASPTDLANARRLRSAIWATTDAVIDGRPIADPHRTVLNDVAKAPPIQPRLDDDGRSSWADPVTGAAVLSAVARDAIDLFGGPRAARLKRCQGVNCAIPFVDTSRPGSRRWCSMDRCGNRAKARNHYHQQRQEASR